MCFENSNTPKSYINYEIYKIYKFLTVVYNHFLQGFRTFEYYPPPHLLSYLRDRVSYCMCKPFLVIKLSKGGGGQIIALSVKFE